MKDAKGNKVGIGTLLYANLGRYGPCARICDFKKDPFRMGYDCAYIERGTVTTDEFGVITFHPCMGSFPINLESLQASQWSATRTPWQEIAQQVRKWWYNVKAELKTLKRTIQAEYRRN